MTEFSFSGSTIRAKIGPLDLTIEVPKGENRGDASVESVGELASLKKRWDHLLEEMKLLSDEIKRVEEGKSGSTG